MPKKSSPSSSDEKPYRCVAAVDDKDRKGGRHRCSAKCDATGLCSRCGAPPSAPRFALPQPPLTNGLCRPCELWPARRWHEGQEDKIDAAIVKSDPELVAPKYQYLLK